MSKGATVMVPPPMASCVLRGNELVSKPKRFTWLSTLPAPTRSSTRIETKLIDRYSASRKRVGPL